MDDNKKADQIRHEIDEIEALLKEWEPASDAHTCWAVFILKKCLERRKGTLKQLLH